MSASCLSWPPSSRSSRCVSPRRKPRRPSRPPIAIPLLLNLMKSFLPILLAVSAQAADLTYPQTRKDESVTDDFHGTKVADPYRWLEDDNSAETKAWVEAQNKLTFGYLSKIPYRPQMKKRIEEVYNYPKYSAPFRNGSYFYFYKNDGLQNQSVLYRQKGLD